MIELLVVIAIIALLMGILLPAMQPDIIKQYSAETAGSANPFKVNTKRRNMAKINTKSRQPHLLSDRVLFAGDMRRLFVGKSQGPMGPS